MVFGKQSLHGYESNRWISSRSLVFLGAWIRKDMVRNLHWQTRRILGQNEQMVMNFSESGHPIFRVSSAFESGELRSKGGGKKSIHIDGSDQNIELLLRTVTSANQFSVYETVADLCDELSESFRALGKLKALDDLDKKEIPSAPSVAETHANE